MGPTGSGARVVDVAPNVVLTLENLRITGGKARQEKGGGIRVHSGALLDLVDAELSENSADEGGGIYNAGTTHISGSFIFDNTAARKGGGIENDGNLTVLNSTITENTGKGGGGLSTAGTAYLSFVTLYSNQSTNKIGAGTLRNGGTLVVRNSIVANNIAQDGEFHDCSGSPNFTGNNIVTSAQGCNPAEPVQELPGFSFPGPSNFGGPTWTLAFTPANPDYASGEWTVGRWPPMAPSMISAVRPAGRGRPASGLPRRSLRTRHHCTGGDPRTDSGPELQWLA